MEEGGKEGGREGGEGRGGEGRGGEGACKGRREEGRVFLKEGGRGKKINQDHLQVGQVIGAGVGTLQRNVGASLMAAAWVGEGRVYVGVWWVSCCLCSYNISCPPIYPTHSLPGASRWGGIQVLLY